MSIAFVVGNGRSRTPINLEKLRSHGTIYACNAVYRDFMPDYLIAVDTKMIIELTKNKIEEQTKVWTNYNNRHRHLTNLNFIKPSKGWSSGPTALWLASQESYTDIYILGFDYQGINGKLNNVYSDTPNYRRSTDPATYHGNWLKQTETVFKEHSQIKYHRVVGDEFIDFNWTQLENYENLHVNNFKSKFLA
jgi:hypothetical protein